MKSVVGLVLGLVGAIMNMFVAMVFGILFILIFFLGRRTLIDYNLSETLIAFAGTLSFWLIVLALLFMIVGIVGLIGASMMNRDYQVRKGGIICLVSGIFSINPFLFIGGIMGMILAGQGYNQQTVSY